MPPWLKAMRPHQWIKNTFVLAPLVFARRLGDQESVILAACAFACFCAAASAVYLLNDIRDVDADRLHPTKCNRPIASGALTIDRAVILALSLALVAVGGSLAIDLWFGLSVTVYLTLNLGYSFGLKNVPYLDVTIIAAGFVLRVWGGSQAIDVRASYWLIICTALLAGFLGFGKRAQELRVLLESSPPEPGRSYTRISLHGYSLATLRILLLCLALAVVAAYGGYVRDFRTTALFGTDKLFYSLPFCLIGIGLYVNHALFSKDVRPPTEAMLRDKLFMGNLALWGITVIAIIYFDWSWLR